MPDYVKRWLIAYLNSKDKDCCTPISVPSLGPNYPQYIIIHHTGGTDKDPLADTSHHTFQIVDNYHKSLGWGKMGYHYFIEKDGRLTQGRMDYEEGAHTIGYNRKSIGVCLAGNFDAADPTEEQKKALRALLISLTTKFSVPLIKIVPHREFTKKTCFGKRLSNDWAQKLITN